MEHSDLLHRCFRCGYCKFTSDYSAYNCPPLLKFPFETYSPGGRMWLLRAWLNDEVPFSSRLAEIFYSCTSCGNCAEGCVMEFKDKLPDVLIAGRGAMVEGGVLPPAVRDYFKSISLHGNPYRQPEENRGKWAEGTGLEDYKGQEFLFYVGCVGAFDERGQKIAKAAGALLASGGLSVGILGAEEMCDGNEVRTMGEPWLFQSLAQRNIEEFRKRGVKKVIALSPHSYNAFKNDYGALGADFQVVHVTQAVEWLVRKGRVSLADHPAKVTYHDPCYLGRHNGVYDPPRKVLNSVRGLQLIEMDRSKKNALCCGGGGGNFFTDILGAGPNSPARVRVREAVAAGAEVLATACPTCTKMLDDAAKAEALDDRIQVTELSELALASASGT